MMGGPRPTRPVGVLQGLKSEYWFGRAKETRAVTRVCTTPEARNILHRLADTYDEMARYIQRREKQQAMGHVEPEERSGT